MEQDEIDQVNVPPPDSSLPRILVPHQHSRHLHHLHHHHHQESARASSPSPSSQRRNIRSGSGSQPKWQAPSANATIPDFSRIRAVTPSRISPARSRSPTPQNVTKKQQRYVTPTRRCASPDELLMPACTMEHRFMQCSCCSKKESGFTTAASAEYGEEIGLVERELRVEGPRKAMTSPPKKPPMRFGLGQDSEARVMENAKARFTVLPVVTLSRDGRQRPAWMGRACNSRVNPVYKGGWKRNCASVMPRRDDQICSQSPSLSPSPSPPAELDLATPQLNSTARLLHQLEQAKQERFHASVVFGGGKNKVEVEIKQQPSPHQNQSSPYQSPHPRPHRNQSPSAADLSERYKNLCKITDPPIASERDRMRKQKTEMTVSLRRTKPSVEDLWIASEQCTQVCSTAPIRIEPSEWLHSQHCGSASTTSGGDSESQRELLCKGARSAMSSYHMPNRL